MQSPLPFAALLFNAFVWGLAWWPFQRMHQAGLHPLWATAFMYAVVLLALLAWRPTLWAQVRQHPELWLLALASGLNNVAFNWAVTIGDVVRVILLFYLMPAWAVLLAWRILGERPTPAALLRLALAFAGVVLVLLPEGAPASRLLQNLSLADGLALLGGFMFALTNVTLRRLHAVPGPARMFSMFGGCMLMALAVAGIGLQAGQLMHPAYLTIRADDAVTNIMLPPRTYPSFGCLDDGNVVRMHAAFEALNTWGEMLGVKAEDFIDRGGPIQAAIVKIGLPVS